MAINTIAPQMPVKITTALWFSILAPAFPQTQSQRENIEAGGALDGHRACFTAMIIPHQEETEIMMMPAEYRSQKLMEELMSTAELRPSATKKFTKNNSFWFKNIQQTDYNPTRNTRKTRKMVYFWKEGGTCTVSRALDSHPLIQWIRLVLISKLCAPWLCHISLTRTKNKQQFSPARAGMAYVLVKEPIITQVFQIHCAFCHLLITPIVKQAMS